MRTENVHDPKGGRKGGTDELAYLKILLRYLHGKFSDNSENGGQVGGQGGRQFLPQQIAGLAIIQSNNAEVHLLDECNCN